MAIENSSTRQHGLREFALKHLTRVQFPVPSHYQLPIPKWQSPVLGGGIVGMLVPSKTYEAILDGWQFVIYNSTLLTSPKIYGVSLNDWQVISYSSDLILLPKTNNIVHDNWIVSTFDLSFVLRVSIRSRPCLFPIPQITDNLALLPIPMKTIKIAPFTIKVFGKRYRLAVREAEQQIKPKQRSLFAEPVETLPSETEQPIKPLYTHLYDLLYPPPDEIAGNHLPQYDTLYPYQKEGVDFLLHRDHALLADDMGLGKTAQSSIAIAILRRSERIGRTLIICPRAVIRQWQVEALRWGNIHAKEVEGTPGHRAVTWALNPGVLLATPHIVEKDFDIIEKQSFDLVVCDDVSMLKNPSAKITKAIRDIPRKRSWCLNGTPLENKPEDLTNVMEFVYPGLFSAAERTYAPSSPIVKKRVAPHFLRRTKTECLKDLPPKNVSEPLRIQMSPEQWETYRIIEQREWNEFQKVGIKAGKVHIFAIIIRLIQICNYDEATRQSAKADALEKHLVGVLTVQEPEVKAIVFSRFVKTLEFLEKRLARHNPILYHGGLTDQQRDGTLKRFRKEGRLLLMSTKSGARGINLQEANHVFHFDRTYNPVDALQGEDRCWRLGQQREVFVNRYLQTGTIEERIDKILRHKKNLIDEYVESMADDADDEVERIIGERWKIEELIEMLRPSTPTPTK